MICEIVNLWQIDWKKLNKNVAAKCILGGNFRILLEIKER